MQLQFLGTGAGRPTIERNVTSIVFSLPEPQHSFWLFDAGEGTQHRLLETKLKLNKLQRIFITHLHGDHVYGLPGLLSSRTFYEGAGPLQLFGPKGLHALLDGVFQNSGAHLNYELEIFEIEEGPVFSDDRFTVEAAELDHRIRCFGYRIEERPRPGQLNIALLSRLGVPPGPSYGKLKSGEDVTLSDGRIIRSEEVVGQPAKGRILTILGDTCPCDNAIRLAQDADLLVHEATFAAGMEEKAAAYGHSTVLQAAQIASKAGAKRLAVTHFSSRFDRDEIAELVESVKSVFPNVVAANDYLELAISKST
ncbi:ribonuclease Z [Paenibacillus sp. MBLB4367]|uniref:ribonuclease Z n=1 Tax=Paenibacillus sp. MBLB4367 TaxID=3384767 RepID=UPI003907EA88